MSAVEHLSIGLICWLGCCQRIYNASEKCYDFEVQSTFKIGFYVIKNDNLIAIEICTCDIVYHQSPYVKLIINHYVHHQQQDIEHAQQIHSLKFKKY